MRVVRFHAPAREQVVGAATPVALDEADVLAVQEHHRRAGLRVAERVAGVHEAATTSVRLGGASRVKNAAAPIRPTTASVPKPQA